MEEKDFNLNLFNLITMFASTCWYQLGKVPSPVDGKISRDLDGAKFTIDTLLMLKEKTKGNLTKKEEETLSSTISNLQINYADEAAKPQAEKPKEAEDIEESKHQEKIEEK
ncbi:MAG: DUF1844 domain-containing protein [Elusimicrobiota bacterium]|jgi:hypothetical protein|nr:DUF1844 domain-containing protein [Elusimicrobiota bacterium]